MKRLIFTWLICAFAFNMNAQDMASVFIAMPDQHIPQLEGAWRKDLVDLYKSGKEPRLKNTMNGFSRLDSLTTDYLLLETTERSTIEMKLLPLINKTFVVGMITTVKGPAADSRIQFFTTDWEPLETSDLFEAPTSDEWYLKKGVDREDPDFLKAKARLDMDLVQYQFSPENKTLTATYTTPLYLSKEEREKVEPYLAEPHVYKWKKHHFK